MPTLERWHRTFERLGVEPAPDEAFEALLAHYSEPHRHYHSLAHLEECFAQLDAASTAPERSGELEFALFAHDVIYDTRAADNEARSADWAADVLREAGVGADAIGRVRQLVLATQHAGEARTPDEQLLLDIDLSILGQPAERFDRYEEEVRAEYEWVPEEGFRVARANILQHFLDRARLYETDEFFERYEAAAGENLSRSLAALATQGS